MKSIVSCKLQSPGYGNKMKTQVTIDGRSQAGNIGEAEGKQKGDREVEGTQLCSHPLSQGIHHVSLIYIKSAISDTGYSPDIERTVLNGAV